MRQANGRIYPEWPVWSGVSGAVSSSGAWEEQRLLQIDLTPGGFPHEAFVAQFEPDSDVQRLLRDYDFADIYWQTAHPAHKAGLIFAAFAAATPLSPTAKNG